MSWRKFFKSNLFYRDICRILGYYFLGFSLTFIIPLTLAAYYQYIQKPEFHPQPHSTLAFAESILITLALAGLFLLLGSRSKGNLFRKEGLATVVLIWFLTPLIAALPFYLSGTLKNPIQAYFEACSGLTTTGSSIMHAKLYDSDGKEIPYQRSICGIHNTTYEFYGTIAPAGNNAEGIEAVSKAVLFWRSFTNWLGGAGIVMLFVAILPMLGVGGKVLFQTEVPGPHKEALTPRVKETAIYLWKIYLGLTLLQIILLLVTNQEMEWLDAVTVSLSTISTGGFSIHNQNIAYYHNMTTEWVIIVFMILGSINFSLYYYALHGKIYRFYEAEFLLFLIITFIVCFLASWWLLGSQHSTAQAIHYGIFHLVSAISTTGFNITNYNTWPYLVQALMWVVMFLGGMSGSTAGGMKTLRLIMLFRIAINRIESIFRPQKVEKISIGGREVDNNAAMMALCFLAILSAISVGSTVLFIANGIDPSTSLSLVACMINDTGMSFGMAGPTESLAFMTNTELLASCFLMILGRLEFFAVLALFLPSFWKT